MGLCDAFLIVHRGDILVSEFSTLMKQGKPFLTFLQEKSSLLWSLWRQQEEFPMVGIQMGKTPKVKQYFKKIYFELMEKMLAGFGKTSWIVKNEMTPSLK